MFYNTYTHTSLWIIDAWFSANFAASNRTQDNITVVDIKILFSLKALYTNIWCGYCFLTAFHAEATQIKTNICIQLHVRLPHEPRAVISMQRLFDLPIRVTVESNVLCAVDVMRRVGGSGWIIITRRNEWRKIRDRNRFFFTFDSNNK